MDAFNEMRPSVSRYSLENHRSALIDTGACANALPSVLFEEIKSNHPELILNETPDITSVCMASGQLYSVLEFIQLQIVLLFYQN